MNQRYEELSQNEISAFRATVYAYYEDHGRAFPWRQTADPYQILVSEVMLQQTQADRAINKYGEFLEAFPDFCSLAAAHLSEVLRMWQGLGYNRRALALKKTAEIVMNEYSGLLPSDDESLRRLPGIGQATAGAVRAFAFGESAVFLETNIRAVFIHYFFGDHQHIRDRDLLDLVKQTLDVANPRDWYYALMDYGVLLKRQHVNPGRRSAHYRKQSRFSGSNRELRGKIIRALIQHEHASAAQLAKEASASTNDVKKALDELQKHSLIKEAKGTYWIE